MVATVIDTMIVVEVMADVTILVALLLVATTKIQTAAEVMVVVVDVKETMATVVVAASTESTNGTVCLTKTMPGKFASRALPSVSAVMPVLSDTKYAARTARVVVSVMVVSAMRRH